MKHYATIAAQVPQKTFPQINMFKFTSSQMFLLSPNQQCQMTEGNKKHQQQPPKITHCLHPFSSINIFQRKRGFIINSLHVSSLMTVSFSHPPHKHQYETFHLPACLYSMYCPVDVNTMPFSVTSAG